MAMKCEADNCENEATVHLTEIREGVKHEMHLCESCAAAKGLPGKSHFTIQQLLAGIASQTQALSQQKTRRGKDPACPACGTTLSQFQSSGRFGCPECYVAFREDVQNLVEKIHDSTQHCGKVPKRTSSDVAMQKDLRQLQVDLKRRSATKNTNARRRVARSDPQAGRTHGRRRTAERRNHCAPKTARVFKPWRLKRIDW